MTKQASDKIDAIANEIQKCYDEAVDQGLNEPVDGQCWVPVERPSELSLTEEDERTFAGSLGFEPTSEQLKDAYARLRWWGR